MTTSRRLLVGSYTDGQGVMQGARGEGVTLHEMDARAGALRHAAMCGGLVNPAYLALASPDGRLVLAACEEFERDGELALLRVDGDSIEVLARRGSHGRASCHVLATPALALVPSYSSGVLAVFPRDGERLGEASQVIRYEGSSVNPARQESPHPHQSVPSPCGRRVYVCDLGSDVVWRHDVRGAALSAPEPALLAPPGSGPRHLCLLPGGRHAAVLCELSNELLLAEVDPATGAMALLQRVPGLRGDAPSAAAAAIHLHPSGCSLLASFRGANRLSQFTIAAGGGLDQAGEMELPGDGPRDFAIEPTSRRVVVALQHSHLLATRALDATGEWLLHPCASPVCVLPLP